MAVAYELKMSLPEVLEMDSDLFAWWLAFFQAKQKHETPKKGSKR